MLKKFVKKDKKSQNSFAALKKKKIKVLENASIFVNLKKNNTHLTLANSNGEVIFKQTAGLVGFKGREKRTQLGKKQNIRLFLTAIKHMPKVKNLNLILKNTGRRLRKFLLKETLHEIRNNTKN
jgi:ribosomal protein S11